MLKAADNETVTADASVIKLPSCLTCLKQIFSQRLTVVLALGFVSWLPFAAGQLWPAWTVSALPMRQELFWILPVAAMLAIIWFVWLDVIKPWLYLRVWLLEMHGGNLAARVPRLKRSGMKNLRADLNSLATMLETQSNHSERQLRMHTRHIDEKNRSLDTLYRIVSSLNTASFDDMFPQVLKTITEKFGINAGIIRRRLKDGRMRKLASVGAVPAAEDQLDLDEHSPLLSTSAAAGRMVVSLQYRNQLVGVCGFYASAEIFEQRQAWSDLLTSIGRHLGIAIEKARLDEENVRLSIMEERDRLANELHDSLAQTVSSLRLQVRVLDQNVHESNEAVVWQNLEDLESSLEVANHEVRQLIDYFKGTAALPKVSEIDQFVERFQRENQGIEVFLDTQEWNANNLPSEYTLQVLRIIQEALTNAHKHGAASFARVYLRSQPNGEYFVLIEDNGKGFPDTRQTAVESPPDDGEKHFGLNVMRERAASIGGRLDIDSESGEGTRVTLYFHYLSARSG